MAEAPEHKDPNQSYSRLLGQASGPRAGLPEPLLGQLGRDAQPTSGLTRKLKSKLKCWSVFGRFPATLGPRTPLNGPGSKTGAERAYNQPWK